MPDFTHLLIDLDDTIYASNLEIWNRVQERIFEFMRAKIDVPESEMLPLRERLYETYGTTLRGLQIEYNVDQQEYLAYVHDCLLDDLLFPNPELADMLARYPQERWIYTNASRQHAERVLNRLGVGHLFKGIIDVVDTNPYCKPQLESLEIMLKLVGSPDPTRCVFVDDRASNLDTAAAVGILPVQVSSTPHPTYATIARIEDLPRAFPPNGSRPSA